MPPNWGYVISAALAVRTGMKRRAKLLPYLLAALGLPGSLGAQEVVSELLTDAIYRGSGVIDLLKDVSGDQLSAFINEGDGRLLLGVDVNEDNSGNENSDSLGVAIKDVQLAISTTEGDFTFTDFFTSTTALLREDGSATENEFYTLFGQAGSSQITGSGGFDLATFDDVLWIDTGSVSGTITGAELSVAFLETPKGNQATDAEQFFDFSGGFEDFALLNATDASTLESANVGVADAPTGVTFQESDPITALLPAPEPSTSSPPAAPSNPLLLALFLGIVLAVRPALQSRR